MRHAFMESLLPLPLWMIRNCDSGAVSQCPGANPSTSKTNCGMEWMPAACTLLTSLSMDAAETISPLRTRLALTMSRPASSAHSSNSSLLSSRMGRISVSLPMNHRLDNAIHIISPFSLLSVEAYWQRRCACIVEVEIRWSVTSLLRGLSPDSAASLSKN